MRMIKFKSDFFRSAVVFLAALFIMAPSLTNAEDKLLTQATLLDRIQIEDLLVKYYVDMSAGKSHDLAQYYTEDAVLDVNGMISKGHKEIEALYAKGESILADILIGIEESEDDTEIKELKDGLSNDELAYVMKHLSNEAQLKLAA